MPDHEQDDNRPEIEILPPEPGHKAGDFESGAGFERADPFAAGPQPLALKPWQIILLRIVRALVVIGIVVGAFFLGTVLIGVIALIVVALALWGLWMRATGRSPGIHFRRF